ncbi:MAG: hypothetical protein F4030_04385 [Gammaproteobacteria bacterium]|nr:hypothetical protein [Gammaproteobacteria bacterium]MYH86819.1 hypothetical protein [Gammaproteobacteria bacterium]MYK04216.1 hypothetical protein [Gammaproteobacteria bacterium]
MIRLIAASFLCLVVAGCVGPPEPVRPDSPSAFQLQSEIRKFVMLPCAGIVMRANASELGLTPLQAETLSSELSSSQAVLFLDTMLPNSETAFYSTIMPAVRTVNYSSDRILIYGRFRAACSQIINE